MPHPKFIRSAAALALAVAAGAAQAHPGHGLNGFTDALAHPFEGADHLLAMLTVGLWSAAVLPPGRRWAGPAVFLLLLLAGALLAWQGERLPAAESGVALSVVLLGGILMAGRRLPVVPGLLVIGLAALFHGAVHGQELGAAGAMLPSLAGMLFGSAVLHAVGLRLGDGLLRLPAWTGRAVATLTALAGLAMLAARV